MNLLSKDAKNKVSRCLAPKRYNFYTFVKFEDGTK